MAYISMQERQAAAAKGLAMPDGSYPIRNQGELDAAWKLRGHSKKYGEQAIIAHIKKAARRQGLRLPEELRDDDDKESDQGHDIPGVLADLEKRQEATEKALSAIGDAWLEDLANQAMRATDATSGADAPPAFAALLAVDPAAAAEVMARAAAEMADTAAKRAAAEAAAEGVEVEAPEGVGAELAAVAVVVAGLVAASLALSVADAALSAWRRGVSGQDVAREVRATMRDFRWSYRRTKVGGLLQRATTLARAAVWRVALAVRPGGRIVATEENDRNSCGPCKDIHRHVFRSMSEAVAAYPAGYYRNCEGGERCRGDFYVVW